MKKIFFPLFLLVLFLSAQAQIKLTGAWVEYKRELVNGEDGSKYTLNGQPFKPEIQFEFVPDSGIAWKADDHFVNRYFFEVNSDTLIISFEYKRGDQTIRVPTKYVIEKYSDELVLRDPKPKLDTKRYMKRYIFKKADKINKPAAKEPIYTVVEEMPEFPGGMVALKKLIADNLQYPKEWHEYKITVYMSMIIGPDGSIGDVDFLMAPPLEFARETIAVLRKMPTWKPGKQNGKAVSVRYNLPIRFE